MLFKKGLKNFLIFLVLISFVPAYAQPSIQRVTKGSMLTFTGWCLSDAAMAKIVADKELEDQRCQLKVDKQRETLSAKFNLDIDTLRVRLSTVQSEHDSIMKIKGEEIKRLEEAALQRPNNYWYLFTAGGFVVGATSVLVIIFALDR